MHGPLQNFYYFPAWRECLHLRELRWPILDSDCTNVCAFNGLLGPNAPLVYTFHSHSMFRFSKIHFPSGKKNYFSRGHPPNCSTLERFQVTPCKKSRENLKINKGIFFFGAGGRNMAGCLPLGYCPFRIVHNKRRCLVVFGIEGASRRSNEASNFFRMLTKARARSSLPSLHAATSSALLSRYSVLLTYAAALRLLKFGCPNIFPQHTLKQNFHR